jgi:hypothetical protein
VTELWIDVRLALTLSSAVPAPEVQIWIDPEPEAGLVSEIPLALTPIGGTRWLGSFSIAGVPPAQFLYRLGLVAHRGARWWLTLRQRGLDHDLLVDGDSMSCAKAMLIGTCAIAAAPGSAVAHGTERELGAARILRLERK